MIGGTRNVTLADSKGRLVGVVGWAEVECENAPPLELMSIYKLSSERGIGLTESLPGEAVGSGPAQLLVFDGNERARASGECIDSRVTA